MSKLGFLIILLFFAALGGVLVGPIHVSLEDVIQNFSFLSHSNDQLYYIINQIRIPRVVSSCFVGGALAVSGLVLQSILRNPLAEPYTLGLSGGASLGAILGILTSSLEPSYFWVPVFSVAGCILTMLLVLIFSNISKTKSGKNLILVGIMVSLFFSSVVVGLVSILSPEKIQFVMVWLMGEFGSSRDQWIWTLAPLHLLTLIAILYYSPKLDRLVLGDIRSLSLGVRPDTTRNLFVFLCTILTALSVAIAGMIGFIGLVSGHLARRIFRSSHHRVLILAAWLIGAIILSIADTIGKSFFAQEIPAGSISALIGAPLLIYLLIFRSREVNG